MDLSTLISRPITLAIDGEGVTPRPQSVLWLALWALAAIAGIVWTVSLLLRRSSIREWMIVLAFWAAMTALAFVLPDPP
jgi:hypothetical protein